MPAPITTLSSPRDKTINDRVHGPDPIPASPLVLNRSTTSDEHYPHYLLVYPGISHPLLHDQVMGLPV
jgi:hypothetical protein